MSFFENTQGEELQNSLWVEKYRPTKLDNYIGNSHLKEKVSNYLKSGDVPHLLFFGKAGTGKTTLAKLIVKSIDCDYMIINASDENNVDTVRNKVKSFASTVGFKDLKVIILDEFDYMTPNAQAILRNLMETFSKHCRFILTCNYVEKIIDPIQSRCQTFQIVPPSKKEVAIHISKILKLEQIRFEPQTIVPLIDSSYPDIRKAIADSRIQDFTEFYSFLYEKVDDYADGNVSSIILILSESQYRDALVIDKEITFMATILQILKIT